MQMEFLVWQNAGFLFVTGTLLSNIQKIKKIKVLGYPFAGGQGKSGVE